MVRSGRFIYLQRQVSTNVNMEEVSLPLLFLGAVIRHIHLKMGRIEPSISNLHILVPEIDSHLPSEFCIVPISGDICNIRYGGYGTVEHLDTVDLSSNLRWYGR